MKLVNPTAPVINLNGTSAQDLIDEYRVAYSAIRVAYEALQRVTVHGRDFQTAPEGVYEKARAEQIARLTKLKEVEDELVELSRLVLEQVDDRLASSPGVAIKHAAIPEGREDSPGHD